LGNQGITGWLSPGEERPTGGRECPPFSGLTMCVVWR
jgi:hypothetical protein